MRRWAGSERNRNRGDNPYRFHRFIVVPRIVLHCQQKARSGAASQLATYKAIVTFLRLTFLRPVERFSAQVISISTEPSAFVREHVRLGDTTNFLRAVGFFVSAISTAFLAEVATLYLLGIGNLTEPYYWFFILLTSILFVLFCFSLVRLIAPLSFKDVLHLSLYPIGAGVFTGAVFALVVSAVVALLRFRLYTPNQIRPCPVAVGQ